jgi:hypothetical protein
MQVSDITKLNRTSQNSFFAALVIIAAAAMYSWQVAPYVKCLYAARQYNYAVSRLEEKNEAVSDEIRVETKKLGKIINEYAQVRGKLFTPAQAKEFFGTLQGMFEETGCIVNLFNLTQNKSRKESKKSEGAVEILSNSATLSFNGDYGSIINVVEGLQNHTPIVLVDSFKVDIVNFYSGQLKCDIVLTIYILQDKEDAL